MAQRSLWSTEEDGASGLSSFLSHRKAAYVAESQAIDCKLKAAVCMV